MTFQKADSVFQELLKEFSIRYPEEFKQFQSDNFAAFGTKQIEGFAIGFNEKAPKWLTEEFENKLKYRLELHK